MYLKVVFWWSFLPWEFTCSYIHKVNTQWVIMEWMWSFRSSDKCPSVFFMIHLHTSFSDGINKSTVSIPVSLAVMRNTGCRNWNYLDGTAFLKILVWINHTSCIYIPWVLEIKYFAFVTGISSIFRVSVPLKWSQVFYFG